MRVFEIVIILPIFVISITYRFSVWSLNQKVHLFKKFELSVIVIGLRYSFAVFAFLYGLILINELAQ